MGDAERGWKSGNRKRERRSPSDDEWRSDGGFACKTKIRVEWGRKVREEDSEARIGWKIRGCLRFVIYKRPFQEASFSSRPPLRHSAGPPPIIWAPPPFSFVYNHRHRPPSGGNRTAISEVANAICFCRYTARNPTSILSRPALWKMRALVGPTFLGKEIYEPRPLIVPSRRDFLFTGKHSAREKIWYAWSPSDVASYVRLQWEFCTAVLQKFL